MSAEGKVRELLEVRVNTVSGGIKTAFENLVFTPNNGVPWQKVEVLWARTDNPTMGDGFRRLQGILQVMLAFPQNAGVPAATEQAALLILGFKRGTTMIDGTTRVLIDASPWISKGMPDGAWQKTPVSIPFLADVYD